MIGLALLYPALEWSVDAPGHHGYPHASVLILGKALRGRLGHQITGATARPFLHLLNPTRRPRQSVKRYGLLKKLLISCCICYDAQFVVAPLCQDRPSDPRQLIGERSCQNIVMQPFRRGREPRSKAMLCPVCRSEQNNSGALHEQRTQVAIAALADAPKDRPITSAPDRAKRQSHDPWQTRRHCQRLLPLR